MRRGFACWLDRAPHEVADLAAAREEVDPDLMVVDANSWGAAAFAESENRPWAMFLPYVLPVPSPDTPAFGPGFAPPRNALDRLRDRAVWAVGAAAGRSHLRRLNSLRDRVGAPRIGGIPELYTRADALIYRTAEPFDYPRRRWPDNVHAVGPGLWAPPGSAPDWLADLPEPRILVSVSTEFQDDGQIIDTALAALAGEPGSVIVTTAAHDPAAFDADRPNVRMVRFLPHAQVLDHVDAVVTHGGMGTVQRALAAGVPLVVVPWGRDQAESARRVQVCGAGAVVARKSLDPQTLRAAVRTALGAGAGAQRVADAFREAGGGDRAARILADLVADPAPAPTPPARDAAV
jgi:MGT family glycosyltransferase